jgi:hypothetical protein
LHFLLGSRPRSRFDLRLGACTLTRNASRFYFSTRSCLRCVKRLALGPSSR